MKITYLGHSGFLVEWRQIACLFDFYRGELPRLDADTMLYVFVSHAHGDHYNREIWEIRKHHPRIQYIVSKKVPLAPRQWNKLELSEEDRKRICRVGAEEIHRFWGKEIVTAMTRSSTDSGVAFWVDFAGKTIFHAGDLNLWTWKEASTERNAHMTQRFMREMKQMEGMVLDAAFFPLDPRQEEECGKGLAIFNRTVKARMLFPMHMWGQYDVIAGYIASHPAESDNIVVLSHEGQVIGR